MLFTTAKTIGNTHSRPGQPGKINNQDVIVIRKSHNATVIILADGCGSQPHSEVGADIGANILANLLIKRLQWHQSVNWSKITKSLCRQIYQFTQYGPFEEFVAERFMFTLTAVIVHKEMVTVAAFGDGMMVLDDKVISFDTPVENTPPYIAYLLCKTSPYHTRSLRKYLQFRIMHHGHINDIKKTLVVATDGLRDLPLDDIHHPAFLSQPNTLQFWLNRYSIERVQDGKIVSGVCKDDVAMVMIRNEEAQEELLQTKLNQ